MPNPPIAERVPHEITQHGHTRIDPYFWMSLTEEQRDVGTPNEHT